MNGCILPPGIERPKLAAEAAEEMRREKTRACLITLVLSAFGCGVVTAQEPIFSGVLSGGLAGSLDEGSGFSNPGFQARFAIETARHQLLSLRLGRMDFSGRSLSLLGDATLDYLTVSGEYLLTEGNYDSGFFIGLGLYDISGVRLDGGDGGQGSIGLILGALGEFDISERWFVYGETAFHYADLDAAQMFANVHIGLGFRF